LLGAAAAIYSVVSLLATVKRLRTENCRNQAEAPAVTVLKPLCGAESGLYECLRSFCEQDYGSFQIVFGVSDGADPAIDVVRLLQREFPNLDRKRPAWAV
jgi:ceramide glucosyltransferase